MANLEIKYMGLSLRNPLVVGSCGLTGNLQNLIDIEKYGAGAVVLKSIFEEQLKNEAHHIISQNNYDSYRIDAYDYINHYNEQNALENFANLIQDAKKHLSIPVIASINCTSVGNWIKYVKLFENAGADAIELNLFVLPTEFGKEAIAYENQYFNLIKEVQSISNLPISIKLSPSFTNLGSFMQKLSYSGIKSLVLFNRFYMPDIDIDKEEITSSGTINNEKEYLNTLRWIAILNGNLRADICASRGIYDGKTLIKMLLAGANAVQATSTFYKNGISYLQNMIGELNQWMDKKGYQSVEEFRGKMSYKNTDNPEQYLRIQFMKYYSERK